MAAQSDQLTTGVHDAAGYGGHTASYVGRRIGPYTITRFLGGGGMGRVFRAEDTSLHRAVAVKAVSAAVSAAVTREQLRREARTIAQLNHRHITHVYEIHEEPDETFIIMEYLEGETLAQRLARNGPLPPIEVVEIGRCIGVALAHAHASNVLHCDLKPANVFLTTSGDVKVMDFGISRLIAPRPSSRDAEIGASPTLMQRSPGTPGYASPEQERGSALDERSDLYSWGVLLHEMATGRRASQNVEPASATSDTAAAARAVAPSLTPSLRPIVRRALAINPADRYGSAAELLAALEAVAPAVHRDTLRARGRVAAFGVSLLLGVALAVSVVINRADPQPRALATLAVLPFTASGDGADLVASGVRGVIESALASAPGVRVVPIHDVSLAANSARTIFHSARQAGVSRAVVGAVHHSSERVSVRVQIADIDAEQVIWSEEFSDRHQRIVELERRMLSRLIGELQAREIVPRLTHSAAINVTTPPTSNVEALSDYSQAIQFLERRDAPANVDHALNLLQSAVRRDPRFALAHAALGTALWNKYQASRDPAFVDRAQDALLEALRLDPEAAGVRVALARLYHGTGRRAQARDELERVLAREPDDDSARALLASVYQDEGILDAAAAELRRAIEIRPGYWLHHASLGRVHYAAGDYERAVSAFTRVTELRPDSSFGFQMRGAAHHMSERLVQAEQDYLRANAIAPSATATLNLAAIYEEQGQLARAAGMYEESIRLNKNVPAAYVNLGDVRERLKQHTAARIAYLDAEQLIKTMLDVNPGDAAMLALFAVCEAKLGRRDEAATYIAKAIAVRPRDREILFQAAEISALLGQPQEALRQLRAAIDHGYNTQLACRDPDLAAVRRLPQARALLGCSQE